MPDGRPSGVSDANLEGGARLLGVVHAGPLKVYFICVGNSCRSQMAEGFARHLGGERVDVRSAGTMPSGAVSRNAIAAMAEVGIDISDHTSKTIDLAFAEAADHVLTMGCSAEEACPAHIVERMVDWGLEDPVGQPMDKFRAVRDEIEGRVRALLEAEGVLEPSNAKSRRT